MYVYQDFAIFLAPGNNVKSTVVAKIKTYGDFYRAAKQMYNCRSRSINTFFLGC